MLKKEGKKYVVYDSEGKEKLGEHESRRKAIAQIAAIEISKAKKGKK